MKAFLVAMVAYVSLILEAPSVQADDIVERMGRFSGIYEGEGKYSSYWTGEGRILFRIDTKMVAGKLVYRIQRNGCAPETSEDVLPFKRKVIFGSTEEMGLPFITLKDVDRREHDSDSHRERFARRWTETEFVLSADAREIYFSRKFEFKAFRVFEMVQNSRVSIRFSARNEKCKDGVMQFNAVSADRGETLTLTRTHLTAEQFETVHAATSACKYSWREL